MGVALIIITIISVIVASLRYHTLSQSNNYSLSITNTLYIYFVYQIIGLLISIIIFMTVGEKYALICVVLMLIFNIVINLTYRTKYKFTKRAVVLFISNNVLFAILSLFCLLFKSFLAKYLFICLIGIAYPMFMYIFSSLVNIYFNAKNKKYVASATEKLKNMDIIKIAITGSYGKTSCKNILTQMLSTKYSVYASKNNFNTPMGIAMSINELKSEQVFIAEMGARRLGDIKELVDIVQPNFGIISGVTMQHLQTFGTLHNIYTEKKVLADFLSNNGTCVFNGNDKYALKMYKEHKGEKMKSCVNKFGDIIVENLEMDKSGCKFSMQIEDEIFYCKTPLLGRHNIINIAICVALATKLGVKVQDIINVIRNLKPTKHRLEYIYSNGIHILDDSYNGNILGVRSALECLAFFDGRKVVFAQGIVELGKEQKSINKNIGIMLSQSSDAVILTGKNKKYIKQGLLDAKYSGEIYEYRNLKTAQKNFKHILNSGDVLLLQNDLPDVL